MGWLLFCCDITKQAQAPNLAVLFLHVFAIKAMHVDSNEVRVYIGVIFESADQIGKVYCTSQYHFQRMSKTKCHTFIETSYQPKPWKLPTV